MANPEHLQILLQGTKAWNRWRKRNPKIVPDLKKAVLKGANLSEANLSGANLEEADLTSATIWNADFSRASLKAANLSGADLDGATLYGAELSDANLEETSLIATNLSFAILDNANFSNASFSDEDFKPADLKFANLSGATLNGAKLIEADLHGANLRGTDLNSADLNNADLTEADLSYANLSSARLFNAKLGKAILRGAILDDAKLIKANLRGATISEAQLVGVNLRMADLFKVNLSGANLFKANLSETNLSESNLSGARLGETDLGETNLSGANLSGAELVAAYLFGSNLTEVNLSNAELYEADLSDANCCKANLSGASLRAARFLYTNLDGATLTGACLWETQRTGWSIKGVICEYAYWLQDKNEKSHYRPGEFERLFADRTRVRLFYKGGFEPLEFDTLPALIKLLEDSHPGSGLRMVGVKEDSGGVVVELAIEDDSDKSPEQLLRLKYEMETTAQRAIEYERKYLAEEKQRLQLEGEVKQLTSVVDKLILRPSINYQGNNMGDTNIISGQAGAVGQNAHAHDMTFNQIVNHFEKSIDLPALAIQLAELREEMAKRQDSSPRAAIAQGEAAKAEIAAKEGNTSKVVEHLKAAGEWTLDFAKEIGKDVVVAAIKTSMGMQ